MPLLLLIISILSVNLASGTPVNSSDISPDIAPSMEAASAAYNDPSQNEIKCSEYSSGWCYLYVYGNKTYYRFTPIANNASQITHVSLNGRVSILADDICTAFPNVVQLHLDYANIDEIQSGALDKCRKVQTIYLGGNNLRAIPKDAFRYNMELEDLYLYNNKLTEINSWLFASLFKLKTLSLYGNYLTQFPAELVKTNKELRLINLYQNDILDLDEVKLVEYLPNLSTFYINNNQIACDRLEKIKGYIKDANIYLSDLVYTTFRKRHYLQDTIDNFLCLPTETWLNVYNQDRILKNQDSSYQVSVSGGRN